MGESEDLFEDLVDAGILDEEDHDWWIQEMRSLGEGAYYEGNAFSLLQLSRWFEAGGWKEVATAYLEKFTEAVDWWIDRNEGLIWFDERVMRWRSIETGRFVKGPEEYIWGMW